MKSLQVMFKKVSENVLVPLKATGGSAGFDIELYLENEDDSICISPGDTYLCRSGFSTAFDENYAALIFNRSSLSTIKKCILPAGVYIIDSDYRGEWKIPLMNNSDTDIILKNGDRIAQCIFIEIPKVNFYVTNHLPLSERGNGGFGSTGK